MSVTTEPAVTSVGIREHFTRFSLLYAAFGFGLGIVLGTVFSFVGPLESLLDIIVETYGTVAPIIIFLILAPSLLRIAQYRGAAGVRFSLFTILWFAKVRILACLFGVVLVSLAFGLPFTVTDKIDGAVFQDSIAALGYMLIESPYFYAIYASVFAVILLRKSQAKPVRFFVEIPQLIELLGEIITIVVPIFTLLVGIYVTTLPEVLASHFAEYPTDTFGMVTLFGMEFDATTSSGILTIYILLSLLTGGICTLWHICLLIYAKRRTGEFSLREYMRKYYLKIYPLLWATSSEALSTPPNMHLLKQMFPKINPTVRHLTVGIGSIININGTLICCFVMIPAVCMILGVPISVAGLLLCFPVIYVIGFGVPGIPGELVLFAGPIMGMLAVPEPLQPGFLLVFIGLQIGLPDSFRTGANSTDEGPSFLLLNKHYQQRLGDEADADSSPDEAAEQA